MKRICVVTVFLVGICCVAKAECGLYGLFSASSVRVLNSDWEYGGTPGFYCDRWKADWAHAGFDLRVPLLGSGTSKLEGGLGGARIRLDRIGLNFKPYAELLAGGSHVTNLEGGSSVHSNSFQYQVVAGVDRKVSPRIDWRLAELSWGRLTYREHGFALTTVSTGLVLRFP